MHQVTLDPVEKVKFTWMVDWPERNVFFQVKNGINDRYSWFAIGFSRRGDFPLTGRHEINTFENVRNVFVKKFLTSHKKNASLFLTTPIQIARLFFYTRFFIIHRFLHISEGKRSDR